MDGAPRTACEDGQFRWQYVGIDAVLFLFFAGLFTVYPPHSGNQVGAVLPLFVALVYAAAGLWTGSGRLTGLGLALGVITVGGYVWLPTYFMLWMAGAGGGALILGGLWLRKI